MGQPKSSRYLNFLKGLGKFFAIGKKNNIDNDPAPGFEKRQNKMPSFTRQKTSRTVKEVKPAIPLPPPTTLQLPEVPKFEDKFRET